MNEYRVYSKAKNAKYINIYREKTEFYELEKFIPTILYSCFFPAISISIF